MDILMVYWNSVWHEALRVPENHTKGASPEEWAAFHRRMGYDDQTLKNLAVDGRAEYDDTTMIH